MERRHGISKLDLFENLFLKNLLRNNGVRFSEFGQFGRYHKAEYIYIFFFNCCTWNFSKYEFKHYNARQNL